VAKDTIGILDGSTFLASDLRRYVEASPGWGRAGAAGRRMEEALA